MGRESDARDEGCGEGGGKLEGGGDEGTERRRDGETERWGDGETERWGDGETENHQETREHLNFQR